MTSVEELQRMISRGEDTQTEFKEVISEDVLKGLSTDLAAIANSQGGSIVFGVTDERVPVGVTLTGDEFNRISQCASNCQPAVRAEPEEIHFGSLRFIVVKVPKSTVIHNDHQQKFPLRLGTTTHYLNALEMTTILQERGFLNIQGQPSHQFPVLTQEKLPIPESEAGKIVRRLSNKNPTLRLETLKDLVSYQYRTLILTDGKIADSLGAILSSANPDEMKQVLDLLRNTSLWGVLGEKKVLSGWLSTILRIGKASTSTDIQRSAFFILMYSKNRGAVDLLVHWVTSLDDTGWNSLQPQNMLRDLGDLRYSVQDEMYKILEDPKDETFKKRSQAVLDFLRQIP